jgi:triacylglycerol esterase/lipase EstA (alpha/beta hydrolase family)
MTAILLLALLAVGVSVYSQWAMQWVSQGAPAWWFIVGAPVAYFAPVVLLVSIWFALAWIWRTPRPREAQLDLAGSLKLFLGEVLAVGVSWPLMALHRLFMRDPVMTRGKRPVILVHGVLVNDGVWLSVKRQLARRDELAVYTINYGPPYGDIEHFADQLAVKVQAVCDQTESPRVLLICHSMGGLVARAYVRHYGASRLERTITLGTPHHGSMLAWMYFGRCLAQMRPGNAWLAELNRDEASSCPVPVTSIWSRHDSMVCPQASSKLACAENVALVGVGHNALLNDARVMNLISQGIA